jgi:hypothetical protein
MSQYYADQLLLQQQEADRLRGTIKADLEQFRQENQVNLVRDRDVTLQRHNLISFFLP